VIVSVALSLATASPVLAEPKDPSHDKVLIANQAALDDFSSSIENELGRAHAAVQSQGQTLRSLGFDLIGLSDINRDDDGFVALVKPSGGLPANASMKAASMLKGANDIPVSLKEANVVAAATRTVDFPNFAAGGFIAPVGRPAGPVGIAAAKGDSGGPVLTYRTDGRAVCCPNLPPP